MILYSKTTLLKKFTGKFINVYPHHMELWDGELCCWKKTWEVRGVSNTIKENYQTPEEVTQDN